MARLAHGWTLHAGAGVSAALVRGFIRPAVRAVPSSLARRLGPCRISLITAHDEAWSSAWKPADTGLEISVAAGGADHHDLALELLLCLGQALWERLSDAEIREYWLLLSDEIGTGVDGEIDEQSLEQKRFLLSNRAAASDPEALARYGRASFAGIAAEFVHSLWHDVTIRTGPDHLPARPLRRRLQLLARWFPPDRGYRLFPGK